MIFTCSLDRNRTLKVWRFCDANDIIKNAWKNEKALIKWLKGMFVSPLLSLAEVYIGTRGLF
jgi:hypothetical protein